MSVEGMNVAGRVGLRPRGAYNGETTYELNHYVYYNGATYVAKKETTGNEPQENNEYWQLFAKANLDDYVKKEEIQEIGDEAIEAIWNEIFAESEGGEA